MTVITEELAAIRADMTPAQYREMRENASLSRRELAELLGVHETAIYKRESGQRAISNEAAIALRAIIWRL